MANLRERLKQIQGLKQGDLQHSPSQKLRKESRQNSADTSNFTLPGWDTCGYQVLKREVVMNAPSGLHPLLPAALPPALAILVPDLNYIARAGGRLPSLQLPLLEDFLFFDLETTGLSGGAGTVAFLAAFGRFFSAQEQHGACCKLRGELRCMLRITQYLLLDYPGENDFIEAVLKEFENKQSIIVSYNGKCFDSQILKTRCLMDGIKPPEYYHADLLHPARRLWKNIIQDCSQSSVETKILGIDRSGDIPGSLAPEIWFDFLRTGSTERLLGICEHNSADIFGLASILAAMISIAADPCGAKYRYDIERLALYWRKISRRQENTDLIKMGDELLRFAAENKYLNLPNQKAAVFRALAIDCERKFNDISEAIRFTKKGLKLKDAGEIWQEDFKRRLERLESK